MTKTTETQLLLTQRILSSGGWRITAIDPDAISELTRDLRTKGLNAIDGKRKARPLGQSSVDNYLKPFRGVLMLAVRRGLIPTNPFSALTEDDRPKREEPKSAHEWSEADVLRLLNASAEIAARPEARYDYTPLLRLVATLGLRLGEVLGLQWQDFDKQECVLYVRRQWTRFSEYGPTKTGAGVRRMALPSDFRDELIALKLRSEHSNDHDPIFVSKAGTPLMHRNVTRRGFEPARSWRRSTASRFTRSATRGSAA